MARNRTTALASLSFLLMGLAACGSKPGTLHVCAAASLRGAFESIGKTFASEHGGITVDLNTAGSQTLKAQIEAGAPCDVLATADEFTMNALVKSGHVLKPKRFASNSLVVIVPTANPGKVTAWGDLAKVARIALAAPEVPVGRYARTFVANADKQQPGYQAAIDGRTKTLELDAAHVVMRVRQGEVDAAIAYRTDARTEGVTSVAIPADLDVAADYPIAIVMTTRDPALASAFVAYVLGPGEAVIRERGFGAPRLQ